MTITAVIAFLASVAKAIPALSDLCTLLINKLEAYDKAKNTDEARQRLAAKDAAVDDAIDAAHRLSISPAIEQQPATNATSSISSSSNKRA